MGEYFVMIVVASSALGLLSFLSYPSVSDRLVKAAASLLLLYTVLIPLANMLEELYSSLGSFDFDFSLEEVEKGEYEEVAEEAFKNGIRKLLFTKYEIEEGEADVIVYGFDFESMKAERIRILLSGDAIYSDARGMQEYLNGLDLGKCEVEIRIG